MFSFLIPAIGAAYGTAKSATGIAAIATMRPDLIMKSVIPVVMAGIVAIYGLAVAVLIANRGGFYVEEYLQGSLEYFATQPKSYRLNLSTRDKMAGLKVSFIQRFHRMHADLLTIIAAIILTAV